MQTIVQSSDTTKAIREAGCGWVIKPENPDALAAKMIEVTEMPPALLQEMGLAGRDYALKHIFKKCKPKKTGFHY